MSLIKDVKKGKAVTLHTFADASNKACTTPTSAVITHKTGRRMGLLTSKSRIAKRNTSIARVKLISGHMGANAVKNLCQALKNLPLASITVWINSMVTLYWITDKGKAWKTFVSNRMQKISQITEKNTVQWKHCPGEKNVAERKVVSRTNTLFTLQKLTRAQPALSEPRFNPLLFTRKQNI